jgi:hypothetical protein
VIRHIVASVAAVLLATGPAAAGPPFVTDDPDPVEFEHVEINIAATGQIQRGGTSSPVQTVDANWGAAPGVQLHAAFGLAYAEHDGRYQAGFADLDLGTKIRLVDQDETGARPEIALYPHVFLPTGDAARGLGAGHVQILLPIWLQRDWGDWTSFGGGGYMLNDHGTGRNNWMVGWTLLNKVAEDLQLGGEIYYQSAQTTGSREAAAFNLGGTWDLSETGHILFSAGRGLEHADTTDRFSFYLGYQITL